MRPGDRAHRSRKKSMTSLRQARASQPSTAERRTRSRTEGGLKAGSFQMERRIDLHRGSLPPSPDENRSRSPQRLSDSHALPKDTLRLATDSAGSSERGSNADGARYGGPYTDSRRPRCSSGSPDRQARDPG